MNIQEKLSKFVANSLLEKNLSTYDVEKRASESGLKITQSYINRIKKGKARNISVPKQKALAVGLGINPQEIYDIVTEISRKPSNFREAVLAVVDLAEDLNEEQQVDIIRTIGRLVRAMRAENTTKQHIK